MCFEALQVSLMLEVHIGNLSALIYLKLHDTQDSISQFHNCVSKPRWYKVLCQCELSSLPPGWTFQSTVCLSVCLSQTCLLTLTRRVFLGWYIIDTCLHIINCSCTDYTRRERWGEPSTNFNQEKVGLCLGRGGGVIDSLTFLICLVSQPICVEGGGKSKQIRTVKNKLRFFLFF